jgi:hypothetical protein
LPAWVGFFTASCRVNFGFYRVLPHITACCRIMFCWAMEPRYTPSGCARKRMPGVLEYGSAGTKRTGSGEHGITRNKVRIITGCYAKFHESSHRSGPWLRDVTHFHGWDPF